MNRRAFLAAGAGAISGLLNSVSMGSEGPSVVAVVSRRGISALNGEERVAVFRGMVETGISLIGEDSFQSSLSNRRTVSLKANCLAGRPLSPDPELAEAVGRVLMDSGVRRVTAWDRSRRELLRAGYSETSMPRVVCTATDGDGVGYSRRIHEYGRVGSLLSNVLLRNEGLISLGILKDHDLSGISCAMKNLFGVIHNPNKYHDDGCDPFVAHVAAMPAIRERLFLSVVDATVSQCHGGPAYSPAWTWEQGSILISLDPVALDAVALGIIDGQRRKRGKGSLEEEGRYPHWLDTADSLGLGKARMDRIVLREAAL